MLKPLKNPERLFIRVKDAAIILGIHHQTLHRWIADGKGPPVQRFGSGKNRMIRVVYPKFLKWIENPKINGRRRKITPPPSTAGHQHV